jgi:cell pole-organizing protein PopZ
LEAGAEADDAPTLEEVVAQIKATPPNPAAIHPATASLADLLLDAPEDPDFDLERWTQQWAAVEAEMKAITRANDIAEGRG